MRWFLAANANSSPVSCALLGGDWSELEELGFKRVERSIGRRGEAGFQSHYVWYKFMPDRSEIEFFPHLEYAGIHVHADGWHPERKLPLLKCLILNHNLVESVAVPGIPESAARLAQTGSETDRAEWLHRIEQERKNVAAQRQKLAALGWRSSGIDYENYLHVDLLTKVQSAPPPGAF